MLVVLLRAGSTENEIVGTRTTIVTRIAQTLAVVFIKQTVEHGSCTVCVAEFSTKITARVVFCLSLAPVCGVQCFSAEKI